MMHRHPLSIASLLVVVGLVSCSVGVVTSSDHCSTDSSLQCAGGTQGYSCTPGATPDVASDPALVCSTPIHLTGSDAFCCFTNTSTWTSSSSSSGSTSTGSTATGCQPDPTITGCLTDSAGNPSYGFTCAGGAVPASQFSNVRCGSGVATTGGAMAFCCAYEATNVDSGMSSSSSTSTSTSTSTGSTDAGAMTDATAGCAPGAQGVTCPTGTTAYGCTGGAPPPSASAPTTVCSEAVSSGVYCCYTSTTPTMGTCKVNPSAACAGDAGSLAFGFSCSGVDSPDMDFSNVTSCAGSANTTTGDTDYCCAFH